LVVVAISAGWSKTGLFFDLIAQSMKKSFLLLTLVCFGILLLILVSCRGKNNIPAPDEISSLELKRGDLVLCGPPDKQFGTVEFSFSGSKKVKKDFNLAIALLHSFEYDEAEKVFSKVISEEPGCAMAYWGVAMSNFHPLWAPPNEAELKKGSKAIEIAQSIAEKTPRESSYINALASFYTDWDKLDHHMRCIRMERAMEKLYHEYPDDKEAAIFYALSLDASASPTDKSFVNQKKAGAILNSLYPGQPNHPGIVHYIIHSYDYPELAELALPAARKYASIAPASAHAQHMPSHIFTRLGLWDECIQSNLTAVASSKCYAGSAGIKGHWDEELHGLDYLEYAYLQKGENDSALQVCNYLQTITEVSAQNFKVAYAYAAIPARYALENKQWKEAASLSIYPMNFPWDKFPWQKAITFFARVLGAVNDGNIALAKDGLQQLKVIYDTLVKQKDSYKANEVLIQIKTSGAWIAFKEKKNDGALKMMGEAADMEEATEKSPVTPGEVLPARELLGDMLLQMKKFSQALEAYEADLKKHPNRFNAVYGAGLSAEKSGNPEKAKYYYHQLIVIANSPNSARPELAAARLFVKKH
jgi:tetratricopeptide (TPR) repeat protein